MLMYDGWEQWANVHDTEDQKKRLESSWAAACTPVDVDPEKEMAHFASKRGNYETTLKQCSCGDFIRRHLPCKHMYRLAWEIGILSYDCVRAYRYGGYSWKEVVEIVEKLSEDAQKEFYANYSKGSKQFRKMKRPELEELITHGIYEEYPESETAKYKTVSIIDDFLVDKQKVRYYFSRKFITPTVFGDQVFETVLPEDDVTAFLRERGFVE